MSHRGFSLLLVLMAAAGALVLCADPALAQGSPFGVRPPTPPSPANAPAEGLLAFIVAMQGEFYRAMTGAVRAAKADGAALWGLIGISFAYGAFHAAGPGHGKAVISSYLLAGEERLRRGIVLAFASAMVQALVAVALAGIVAGALNLTARHMENIVRWIEVFAYGAIALIGLRLAWSKGRRFIAAINAARQDTPLPAEECVDGCTHLPLPAENAGNRAFWSAIAAVGARPCSGAVIVLVFALAQGLFWAGVAATFAMAVGTALTVSAIAAFAVGAKHLAVRFAAARAGAGTVLLTGIETMAALALLAFGLLLLTGQLVSEPLSPF